MELYSHIVFISITALSLLLTYGLFSKLGRETSLRFETVATPNLAKESARPHKALKVTVLSVLLVSTVMYILMLWAMAAGHIQIS